MGKKEKKHLSIMIRIRAGYPVVYKDYLLSRGHKWWLHQRLQMKSYLTMIESRLMCNNRLQVPNDTNGIDAALQILINIHCGYFDSVPLMSCY